MTRGFADRYGPGLDEAVEWRVPIWGPAVDSALTRGATSLPCGSHLLEVGYNTAMMSCYMASRFGWRITGYDIDPGRREVALRNVSGFGLEDRIDLRLCLPEDTLSIQGPYDGVFIKSVLYHIAEKEVYTRWLTWLGSVVRKQGALMIVENGKGGILDRIYRSRLRKSRWANLLLYDPWVEEEFRRIFSSVEVEYFGSYSQFFTFQPLLFSLVFTLERRLFPPDSNRCFVASVVAHT